MKLDRKYDVSNAGPNVVISTQPARVWRLLWLLTLLLLAASTRLLAQSAAAGTGTEVNQQGPSTHVSADSGAAAAASEPSPLATPAIVGPLREGPPITFDAGPLGKLNLNGVASGTGLVQGNHVSGDDNKQAALSDGQVFIQKADGWWQFYVQAGPYNILSLGTPFLATDKAITDLYGPVPVAYLKLARTKTSSIMIGALPTLMGAEYTFDFQNMNIERGLLWSQENAINRGIQLNQTFGKFTASFSWNDGYYSNRYSWLSGSLTYANGPHSVTFAGMGNLGQTVFQKPATPVQNNSTVYAVIYTYSKGNWILQPYIQASDVPTNTKIGVGKGASTWGGALLLSRGFKHGLSLAGRGEYITSMGSAAVQSVNLLYGPGSGAWSLTVTPTFQQKRFFVRGDLSLVRAIDSTTGFAFGPAGTERNQLRGVAQLGFIF